MRTSSQQAWIVLVVACALVGGLAAFLLATPDQSGRVQAGQLGFQQLNHPRVEAALGGAAEHHRQLARGARATRMATAAAAAWLRTVPTAVPATPHALPTAGEGRAAVARIRAFTRWGDDLPAGAWTVDVGAGTASSDAHVVDVRATVDVEVAQAMQHIRRQRLAVTLELTGDDRSWRLADLHVDAPTTFVYGYADPTIVVDQAIDVVATRAQRSTAMTVARDAAVVLPGLRRRYPGIAGADGGTIWLLDARSDARRVLGRAAPAADDSDADAIAWVDARGELALDRRAYVALLPAQRAVVLRHALAHLATLEAATASPPILVEGIAADASRDSIPAAELRPLAAAFATGTSGVAGRVVAQPRSRLDGATDAIAAEAVARWIVHRTDEVHLARLVQRIDSGVSPQRALADVLHATPRDVERGTAAWVRLQLAAAATTDVTSDEDHTT
jgi:hypothetical protein